MSRRGPTSTLGVLAYQALTGKPPFRGRTLQELAKAHARAPVPPLPDSLPSGLQAVLARALAKRPADRFASALELAAAFRAACGIDGELASPLVELDTAIRETYLAE